MKICKFLLFFAEFELNLSLNFAFIKLNFVLIQPYRARKVTTPSSNALKFSLNSRFFAPKHACYHHQRDKDDERSRKALQKRSSRG